MRLRQLSLAVTVSIATLSATGTNGASAQREGWRTSPFHRLTDSGTGRPIPCICRFAGRDFRVGNRVCMQTPHNGVVLVRYDLVDNVTSWVPTQSPCEIS